MTTTGNAGSTDNPLELDHRAAQEALPLVMEIVSEHLKLRPRRVTPLIGMGSVNLVFFAETDQAEIVVRLNKPDDDVAKMYGDYEKERWCIAQASAVGIPGPEVLAVGEHSGRAFMLQRRIPGLNGKHSSMPSAALLRVLGQYARRIHTIPPQGFGYSLTEFTNGDARAGWLRFVDYNLGELSMSDPLLALGVYTRDQQTAIREAFLWLRSLPLRIGLNHGDLSRQNTIVDSSGQVFLLDWGCAEINVVPHFDLNALLMSYSQSDPDFYAFLEGYEISEAEWSRLLPELDAFSLLKAFDLTRWAIDRCPSRIPEIAERAAQCVAQFPLFAP